MSPMRARRRAGRGFIAVWMLASALAVPGGLVSSGLVASGVAWAPSAASAADRAGESEAARKDKWQDRYRALLRKTWRARDEVKRLDLALENARHTKHPRGRARFELKQQFAAAQQEVAKLEGQCAELLEAARRDAVPPGWMSAVEDEVAGSRSPAAYQPRERAVEERSAGRNPLYGEDDEEDSDESDADADSEDDADEAYESRDPDSGEDE